MSFSWKRAALVAAAFAMFCVLASHARAQALAREEIAGRMTVPSGVSGAALRAATRDGATPLPVIQTQTFTQTFTKIRKKEH